MAGAFIIQNNSLVMSLYFTGEMSKWQIFKWTGTQLPIQLLPSYVGVVSHSSTRHRSLRYTDAFYWLFTRWKCETNPQDSEKTFICRARLPSITTRELDPCQEIKSVLCLKLKTLFTYLALITPPQVEIRNGLKKFEWVTLFSSHFSHLWRELLLQTCFSLW